MEGPSLVLAREQLRPFKGKRVLAVSGNTKTDKERLQGKTAKDIFSWGKHLVFQFEDFAVRIHFLLYGSFAAQIGETWVTGDYRLGRIPRLTLEFENGRIEMYNCSVTFLETPHAKRGYDFAVDIMSRQFDPDAAFKAVRKLDREEQIADVLLDQERFAGVGNIIKNEVLSMMHIDPRRLVGEIPPKKLRELIAATREFSHQFYRWRKRFVLRKNLTIHRKGSCPHCEKKVVREKTGKRVRWSYYCTDCQK